MSSLPSSPPPPVVRKKRPRFPDPAPSSDPIFSSDDLQDASLEQYDAPRKHKKQYRGQWWQPGSTQEGPGNSKRGKPRGQFERKMDSGVWMASDDTVESDDHFTLAPPGPVSWMDTAHVTRAPPHIDGKAAALEEEEDISKEERLARREVEKALDTCDETVDLSRLGLESISSSTLRPLRLLTRKSRAMYSPPEDEEAYEDLRPRLQLYLAWNSLRTLPTELWHLENLTVLIVRNNKLVELPPGISNLENIVELNLTANRFKWLPWEILSLSQKSLERLIIYPNLSLLQCIDAEKDAVSGVFQAEADDQLNLPRSYRTLLEKDGQLKLLVTEGDNEPTRQRALWFHRLLRTLRKRMDEGGARPDAESPQNYNMEPVFIASSPVSYLDIDGSVVSGSAGKPSETLNGAKSLAELFRRASTNPPRPGNRAPSLLELSVRCAASYCAPEEMLSDPLPAPLQRVFSLVESAETESTKHEGCRTCSVCDRPYVIPRAEWMECWHWGKATFNMCQGQKNLPHSFRMDEMFLPFLRRACSWGCAESTKKEQEELLRQLDTLV